MLLREANARFEKTVITEEQLSKIHPIYCLLDFDKDDFCKLVEAIGLDKWLERQESFKRLVRAESELTAKESYLKAKARIEELECERAKLEQIVNNFNELASLNAERK